MAEQTPPQIEVTVAAPPEAVWPALRDPALIRRWHGWQFDGDAAPAAGWTRRSASYTPPG